MSENLLKMEPNILFGRQSALMKDNLSQALENKSLIHVNNELYIVLTPNDIANNGIADIKEEIIIPDNIDDYLENNKRIESSNSLKNESNSSKFINEIPNVTPTPRIWVKDNIKLVERTSSTEVQCKLSSSCNKKRKRLPCNNEGVSQLVSISQVESYDIHCQENLSVRKSKSVRTYIPRIKKKVSLPINNEKIQENEKQTELSVNLKTQEIKKEILSPDVHEKSKNKEQHLTGDSEINESEKGILSIKEIEKQLDRNEVLCNGIDEKQVNKCNNESICISNKISKKKIVKIDKRLLCDGKAPVAHINLIAISDDESDESSTEFSPAFMTNNDNKIIKSMINQQCWKCRIIGDSIDIAIGALCKVCKRKLLHRCKICGQIFAVAHKIIEHVIKSHSKKLLKARAQLKVKESQNTNLGESTCQDCDLSFVTKELQPLHIFEYETPFKLPCTFCFKKESNRCKLRHHIINNHKGEYEADSLTDIIEHIALTKDKQIATNIPYYHKYMNIYCMKCKEMPSRQRWRKALCLNCNQPYVLECSVCCEVHKHYSTLTYHVIREHVGQYYFYCKTCPRMFHHKYKLQEHETHCSDEKDYICPDCPAFCTMSKQAYIMHMRGHHHKTTTGMLKCEHCNKLFVSKATLSKHWRWYCRNLKRLQCSVCGWIGLSKKDVIEHIQKYHGKERIIEVDEDQTGVEKIVMEVEEEEKGDEEIIEKQDKNSGDEEIFNVREKKAEEKEDNQETKVKVKSRRRKRVRLLARSKNRK